MPAYNIKLVIAYDGTAYLGWQKTFTGSSIESTLQLILEQILQHPVALQAASRTDAGVHAQGQVVNFFSDKPFINLQKLVISLNHLLPNDIVVFKAEKMSDDFHPTLDCTGKEYHYLLSLGATQHPKHRLYAWHCYQTLCIEHMKDAAQQLIGMHDFHAMCNFKKNARYGDYVREIQDISFVPLSDNRLRIEMIGPNFLYKMVRNIIGTLVYVGRGKIGVSEIKNILNKRDRALAGVTAPPHGLTLYRVFYKPELP